MVRIEDIITAEQKRLEGVLRAAYDAGKADAKTEMLAVLSGERQDMPASSSEDRSSESGRKRAPRGLPKKLTKRVLKENAIYGSTPQDILDAATDEFEKMISISSIRSELRKGLKEGAYKEADGKWYLATQISGGLPSAVSDTNNWNF